jgi:hypothetical protein
MAVLTGQYDGITQPPGTTWPAAPDNLYLSVTNNGAALLQLFVGGHQEQVRPNNSMCLQIPAGSTVVFSGATTALWQVAVPFG